ncbi:DUF6278 family protein [Arthrobacter sp. A5]|uniref:DUF6278 family protein n=1 Tax=Arthrobacter sp. A5 TaxID=576926 RepID=UPI003DA87CAF
MDNLINSAVDVDELAGLACPIGIFYGDVLTRNISGAHWEVRGNGSPCVRVTKTLAVEVVEVVEVVKVVRLVSTLANSASRALGGSIFVSFST